MNPNMKSHFKRWQTLFIFEHNTFCILSCSTDLWECPSGYLLFQETCYKLFRETKNHIRAQRHCENEGKGGKLGSPSTHMQVYNDHPIVHTFSV